MKRFAQYLLTITYIVGLAAVMLGVVLRIVETFSRNYVFGFDQGLDMMAARSIAFSHKFTLIGSEAGAGFAGLPGIFHGPGYHYILAAVLFVSQGNPYGSIVFLAVLSLIVLYALFRLSERVFGKQTAYLVLLLSAVSLPLTAQARMIWAPNFSGIIAVPFIYALWASRKKTYAFIFLTVFLATSLYHFEIPMAIPALVAVGTYFFMVLHIWDFRRIVVMAMGVLFGFFPMILFESRHGWGIVKGLFAYGTRMGSAQTKPFMPFQELIGDGIAMVSTMRESFIFGIPLVTQMFPFFLIVSAMWYAYREKKKEQKHFVVGLLLLVGAHLLVYYPYRGPVYSHYFSLLYVVYPLIGAYIGICALKGRISRWVVYGLGMLLIMNVFGRFPRIISYDYADYGGTAKIKGKTDAINSIYAHAKGEPFNLLVFTPPVYTYAYDYLLGWYALKTYGYLPGTDMKNTVYLLIEPDPEKPWSYNGWLETVIKRGEIVAEWKLPSGFIVQKRVMEEGQ